MGKKHSARLGARVNFAACHRGKGGEENGCGRRYLGGEKSNFFQRGHGKRREISGASTSPRGYAGGQKRLAKERGAADLAERGKKWRRMYYDGGGALHLLLGAKVARSYGRKDVRVTAVTEYAKGARRGPREG